MTQTTRESFYDAADHILQEAAAQWDNVVDRILRELETTGSEKPTVLKVIDTRETSIPDAIKNLQRRNPFTFWRSRMWQAVNKKDWMGAYINANESFKEMHNLKNIGLYIKSAAPDLGDLYYKMVLLSDELAQAGLHK
ncbi:hypothetical protein BFP70_15405 [Thioclava sp. SK-1]|uniref:hypothetical protein n=1 Tax=Thioclava sp. SK-1 TaxID=1889770 RepID=UPI000824C747|nr:hypothetical protein [Thioclava sp. SK-1]OCX61458.1 hypothetical protein BFP70_15405 [Thioclava sp. SK-1]